jgi:ubiquinone/menaquinone biosynthesis C-methylase UbiE
MNRIGQSTELAIKHWNASPLYYSEEERYRTYPWLSEAAEFACHGNERMLEIGCGTGCDLLQFAKHGAFATGVDITPRHLELARQRLGSAASVVRGNATHLPFPDGSFDYVYSHGVLMHSSQPRVIVKEIFRVLRSGGRFNVHVYALFSYFALWRFLQHGCDWKRFVENSPDPVHIDLYTRRSLQRLFTPASVRIRKYHCKPWDALAPWFGWFLVVKGQKPSSMA